MVMGNAAAPGTTPRTPRMVMGARRGARAGAALLAGALLTLSGCGDDAGARVDQERSWLADPVSVTTLIDEHFAQPPTLRRLTILEGSVAMEVRDPAKPQNVDKHAYYAGSWHMTPVRLMMSDIEELDETTFTPDEIDLGVVPGLMAMALEALDLEGEEVQSISFDRLRRGSASGLRRRRRPAGQRPADANADGSDPTVRGN